MKYRINSAPSTPWLNVAPLVLALSACATQGPVIRPPLQFERSPAAAETNAIAAAADSKPERIAKTPQIPEPPKSSSFKNEPAKTPPVNEIANINLAFDQLPLPTFLQTVYGSILKQNFSVDPQVASRTDLVTFRSGVPQTRSQVESGARMLLKSYGVAVNDVGGFLRIVPDNNLNSYAPEVRRGRALPDVPLPMRPIFYLVELKNVTAGNVASYLKQLFGGKLNMTEDPQRAALLLSGQSDDVAKAMEMIEIFDQPMMSGVQSIRLSPLFWNVDELARRLTEILTAEGYTVTNTVNSAVRLPITILPIPAINSMIVLTRDQATLDHLQKWATELDKPTNNARGGGFFSYQVRNGDADAIAKTLQQLLDAPAGAGQTKAASKVVVNAATNSLIIQGQTDQSQLISLLRELDRPVRSALVEVTVAEVSNNGTQGLGVQWRLANADINNGGSLATGFGLGSNATIPTPSTASNLLLSYVSGGQLRAVVNAVAHDDHSRILSTPSLMVRSGEQASIQVGSDVPIVTGTLNNASTGGGTTTTVQYRNSGIVLNVKPVIYSSGRIDLDVSQEVSKPGDTGVGGSPKFDTRRVATKLSLRDGASVMLAGLMRDDESNSDDGVPFLKDIPVVGHAFKSQNSSRNKIELIVLITAYIINDDFEAEAVTDAFRSKMGAWASTINTNPLKPTQLDKASTGSIKPAPLIDTTAKSISTGIAEVSVAQPIANTDLPPIAAPVEKSMEKPIADSVKPAMPPVPSIEMSAPVVTAPVTVPTPATSTPTTATGSGEAKSKLIQAPDVGLTPEELLEIEMLQSKSQKATTKTK